VNPSPWLVRQSSPQARLRLFCFPYAGGSAAAFAGWQAALGPEIEVCAVQLPGRGARMGEPPMTSLNEVVASLAQVIGSQSRMPFAFFGHSLGGLLAYELARFCMLHYLPLPVHLFASGCSAPQHRGESKNLHQLPDDELIEALRDYNGTPVEVLANRELMLLLLPVLRADFGLVEHYRHRQGLRLPMPITVLAGEHDERTDPAQVDGWAKESAGPCAVHWFDGDHFFINAHRDAVQEIVRDTLAARACA
jgi:surfactin synthase thioesterase subunit